MNCVIFEMSHYKSQSGQAYTLMVDSVLQKYCKISWLSCGQAENEYQVLTLLCFCISGGEGADSPRAELIHAAPHTGLLCVGRPGPAARPGETLRDDPKEEKDAAAQQKEEMRWEERCSARDRGDFLNHSLSEDLLNRYVCDTFGPFGGTRRRACQTSWAVFNQTVALKCMPNVNAFLLDIWTDLLPLGLFLF